MTCVDSIRADTELNDTGDISGLMADSALSYLKSSKSWFLHHLKLAKH